MESRQHDTPPLMVRMQKEVQAILSEARDQKSHRKKLEEGRAVLARYVESVAQGSVAIEDLVISKRITRVPRDYQKASLTAIVGQQLFGSSVKLRPGENVEYIITDAEASVPNDRARVCIVGRLARLRPKEVSGHAHGSI